MSRDTISPTQTFSDILVQRRQPLTIVTGEVIRKRRLDVSGLYDGGTGPKSERFSSRHGFLLLWAGI